MANTGWDFESNSGAGTSKAEFTKFPQGITNVRLIDPAPYMRWVHWMPQFKRSVNCPGKGCPICDIRRRQKANKQEYTYSMSRRLAINVLNRATTNLEIMEQGVNFFNDVKDIMTDINEDGKTLLDVDIKVRRRGTGKDDTSYRVDQGDAYELTDDDRIKMDDKIDLAEYFKPHTPEQITRLLNGEKWEDVMSAPKEDSNDIQQDSTDVIGEDIEIR